MHEFLLYIYQVYPTLDIEIAMYIGRIYIESCYVFEVRKFYDLYIFREKDLRCFLRPFHKNSTRTVITRLPVSTVADHFAVRSFVFSSYVRIPPTLSLSLSLSLSLDSKINAAYSFSFFSRHEERRSLLRQNRDARQSFMQLFTGNCKFSGRYKKQYGEEL